MTSKIDEVYYSEIPSEKRMGFEDYAKLMNKINATRSPNSKIKKYGLIKRAIMKNDLLKRVVPENNKNKVYAIARIKKDLNYVTQVDDSLLMDKDIVELYREYFANLHYKKKFDNYELN